MLKIFDFDDLWNDLQTNIVSILDKDKSGWFQIKYFLQIQC